MKPSASESFPRKQAAWNVSFGSGQTSCPRTAGLRPGGLYAEAGALAGADSIGIMARAVAAAALARWGHIGSLLEAVSGQDVRAYRRRSGHLTCRLSNARRVGRV